MPNSIDVVGVESLARLSRAMHEAGERGGGMRRELTKGLAKESAPIRKEMRAAIVPALPKRGGLAADVLRSTRFTSTVSTGSTPSVRIKVRSKRSVRRMNATGSFRHPVFGRRDKWVTQRPTVALKDFLDRPFEKAKPGLQQAVLAAITRVRGNLNRSI